MAWCLAEAGDRDRAAELLRRTAPASAAGADKNYLWWAVIVGFSDAADLVVDPQWAQALYDLATPYAGSNCDPEPRPGSAVPTAGPGRGLCGNIRQRALPEIFLESVS
jgi:hypothetical protein